MHDFAPRFGFAYQPKAGGKLVIRGGWGMFYQVPNIAYFGDSGASNGAGIGNQREHRRTRAGFDTWRIKRRSLSQSGVPIFAAKFGDRVLSAASP